MPCKRAERATSFLIQFGRALPRRSDATVGHGVGNMYIVPAKVTSSSLDVIAPRLSAFRLQDNMSPLHVAAGMGHIEVTKRLLENGAQIEAKDNRLYTPLWRASYYGHPEVVKVKRTRVG